MRAESCMPHPYRVFELTSHLKQGETWKKQTYPVPSPSKKGFYLKAVTLRQLGRWTQPMGMRRSVTIVVPALWNYLPAEGVALGWLNDIETRRAFRHRMMEATKIAGWDLFTFHTLHNRDPYYDSAVEALRETWLREGTLSRKAVQETRRRFGRPYDYHRMEPKLVENLVMQSAILEWMTSEAASAPIRFHFVGTALLSALAWSGALRFSDAVGAAIRIGEHWEQTVREAAVAEETRTVGGDNERVAGWIQFLLVKQLIQGRSSISVSACPVEMPEPNRKLERSFWYSAGAHDTPVRIETSQEALEALGTLNLSCWAAKVPRHTDRNGIRGWLISPLHPLARACRWSLSNYLLATPSAVSLFVDHIAPMGELSPLSPDTSAASAHQGRLRVSKIKVTGP